MLRLHFGMREMAHYEEHACNMTVENRAAGRCLVQAADTDRADLHLHLRSHPLLSLCLWMLGREWGLNMRDVFPRL